MRDDVNRNDERLSQALTLAGVKGLVKGPAKLGPIVLAHPSFEVVADGAPVGWRSMNHSSRADLASDGAVVRTGKRSARIVSGGGADSNWSHMLPVKPGTDSRFPTMGQRMGDGNAADSRASACRSAPQPGGRTAAMIWRHRLSAPCTEHSLIHSKTREVSQQP